MATHYKMQPPDQVVMADCRAHTSDILVTLAPLSTVRNSPRYIKKIPEDTSSFSVTVEASPGDVIEAGGSITFNNPGDSTMLLPTSGGWRVIAGFGPTGSGSGAAAAPPGEPAIVSVIVIDNPGRSGYKKITVSFTPPAILGTFKGNWAYLDVPDSSDGTLASVGDGTVPADGQTPANGAFAPISEGFYPYDPTTNILQFSFDHLAPTAAEYWRVYLCGGSAGYQVFPVQNGQSGATPSYQVFVAPRGSRATGREYAPLVLNATLAPLSACPAGWTANPNIVVDAAGGQTFQAAAQFTWPATDRQFQQLAGVKIIEQEGPIQVDRGTLSVTGQSTQLYITPKATVLPGTTAYDLYFLSVDASGDTNTLVLSVTPTVAWSITPSVGTAGEEYAALVTSDGVHPFITVTAVNAADGTALLQVDAYWKNLTPSDPGYDPRFSGAEIIVDKNDTKGPIWNVGGGTLSPVENDISQPATVQTWKFYLVSVDANGNANTVVPGTTPSVTLSVGNASGQLNLGKALATSLSSQMGVVAGAVTITNLAASTIVTGIMQVGGGGNKVSAFIVFDTFNSAIGFIGDGNSVSSQLPGAAGFSGGWVKQFRIGGTSPFSAPISTDTLGNVQIAGSVIIGQVASSATATTANNALTANTANQSSTVVLPLNGITTTITNASVFANGLLFPAGLHIVDSSGNFSAVGAQIVALSGPGQIAFLGISGGVSGLILAARGQLASFFPTQLSMTGLPSFNPGAGTNQFWYNPGDSNRVYFAA